MNNLRRIETSDNSIILIETKSTNLPHDDVYIPGVSQTGAIQQAKEKLTQELTTLSEDAIRQISRNIAKFSKLVLSEFNEEFGEIRPTISFEYGVNVVGEIGIEIVKASGEGTFQVSVTWERN